MTAKEGQGLRTMGAMTRYNEHMRHTMGTPMKTYNEKKEEKRLNILSN